MADVFNPNMCTYCQEEISGLKVQCCVCENFIICLQCFSAGAEIGSHKNNHNYKFVLMDNNIMFKGPGNWSAREQLHLLHAVEVLGFGNWEGVSKFIESRTAEELKTEYISRFVDGAIGQATWPGIVRPQLIEDREENTQLTPEQQLASRLPPLDIRVEETRLLGYMPKRDDFDREYNTDTEAEKLVSSLFGGPTEGDELETALKLAQVDMYVRRLRERARRKRVVRDYQLVAKFFTSSRKDLPKQSFTKEQREFRDRMRVFCQFNTGAEHEQLISGLEREQELRLRLSELARYRRAGVTHSDECTHYERHTSYDRQRNEPASATSAVALAATAVKTPAQWKHAKSQWIRSLLPGSSSGRKKRRRKRLMFHRPKVHVPHRRHLYKRVRKVQPDVAQSTISITATATTTTAG